jgi:predicted RNA binding protein YcfA (HicA-like mRNA interferase family)
MARDRLAFGDGTKDACRMKVRDLVLLIKSDGWKHVRTTGGHRHFKHATKPNVVTVSGNGGDDIPLGTLKGILKAAGLEVRK